MNLPIGQFVKGGMFKLTTDYEVKFGDIVIVIRHGFVTNGASIPRIFWAYGNPFGDDTLPGAIVHDALYQTHDLPRMVTDAIFFSLMKDNQTKLFKRWIYFLAVRLFGWICWGKPHCKKDFLIIINK